MKTLTLFLLLLGLTACNASPFYRGDSNAGQTRKLTGEGPIYQIVFSQVIEPKCLQCHTYANQKGGVNLESYEATKNFLPKIKEAVETDYMPMRDSLSLESKELILQWIAMGAPEN